MAKRKKRNSGFSLGNPFQHIDSNVGRVVGAILLFVTAFFLLLAFVGYAGIAGEATRTALFIAFGWGFPLLPLALVGIAVVMVQPEREAGLIKWAAAGVFFLAALGLTELIFKQGGTFGTLLTEPLIVLFDVYVTVFLLWGLAVGALVLLFDLSITEDSFPLLTRLFRREQADNTFEEDYGIDEYPKATGAEEVEDEPVTPPPPLSDRNREDQSTEGSGISFTPFRGSTYTPPPLSLLEKDRGKPGVGDIKANANIIKRTLLNFGITVEIDEISIGPSATRYALKPAEGVRLSKIMGLQNNLELALAAHPVRIEAPIPGRSLVGIEVPNTAKATVGLATLLAQDSYQNNEKPLLAALGKDITGQSHFANIGKMPHLLIAGATGSGKSVTIHSLITSLLYRNSPEMLRFIMADPKRVELTLYNSIPHLLSPVITDAKKTVLALKWAAKEMDRRYDILEAERVRDIVSYHTNILAPALKKKSKEEDRPEAMPYIIIVIDELADIMQAYPRELEAAIVRLAQMSRAVGIHLILSTQRPSVNVITGLIKANVPARIALQVSSQIDSRTILDSGGAEKLLGAGDMLYLSGEMSKPQRIQSAFITEEELKRVTNYIIKHNESEYAPDIEFSESRDAADERGSIFASDLDDNDDDDELYEEAREIVIGAGKASTSYIQRKLRVGYARAARLMDLLEERGVIGPADGSRPREVLEQNDTDSEGAGPEREQ